MTISSEMPVDFELEAHRHQLKQLRDSGPTALYAGRDGIQCPVCDRSFHRLFATTEPAASFPDSGGDRFCVAVTESHLLLVRH